MVTRQRHMRLFVLFTISSSVLASPLRAFGHASSLIDIQLQNCQNYANSVPPDFPPITIKSYSCDYEYSSTIIMKAHCAACWYTVNGQDYPIGSRRVDLGAEVPAPPDDPPNDPPTVPPTNKCASGSIVNVDTQSVGESIPIVGTPFSLNYSSERVPGRRADYKVRVPVTSSTLDNYSQVDLKIEYAGRLHQQSFSNVADQFYDFEWDGLDNSSQPVNGKTEMVVTLSGTRTDGNAEHARVTSRYIGVYNPKDLHLGGWTLSNHHYYDVRAKRLYLGTGGVTYDKHWDSGTYNVLDQSGSLIYTFNTNGRHLTTRNALTNAVIYTFGYDGQGRLTSVTDAYGNQTLILRNLQGVITGIESPYGQVTQISLDANGWISEVRNPNNEAYEMTYYGTDGLMHTFQKPRGQVATFTYTTDGRLQRDESTAGNSLDFVRTRTGTNSHTVAMTSAEGRTETVSIAKNSALGYYRTEVNSRNENINVSYTKGAGYSYYNSARGGVSYNYTPSPRLPLYAEYVNVSTERQGSIYSPTYITKTVEYPPSTPHELFNFTKINTTYTNGSRTTTEEYDAATKKYTTTSPVGRVTKVGVNDFGETINTKFATFAQVDIARDANGRVDTITQGSRQTEFNYDASGRLSSVENALNQTTSYQYDNANRVTHVTLPDTRVVEMEYDANGNLTGVTPPGKTKHGFLQNLFDLISSFLPPSLGGGQTVATQYQYNDDKQLTQITRPDAQQITFAYNSGKSTLSSVTTPSGNYTYVFGGDGVLTNVTSPDQVTHSFNWSGALFTSGEVYQNSPFLYFGAISISYNNDFNPTSITVNGVGGTNNTASFSYDNDRLVTQAGGVSITRQAATGFVGSTTLGVVGESYTYDSTYGELASLAASVSGSSVFDQSFVRDALGRVTSKTETVGGVTKAYGYTYDSAGRLTDVTINGVAASNYTFDTNSNRTGGTVHGTAVTATYDAQDRLSTYNTKSYTYNLNGELTSVTDSANSQTTSYTYDVMGNLKSVTLPNSTQITYKVDGLNRRAQRLVGGTLDRVYLYQSSLQLAAELDGNRQLLSHFIYGTKSHVPDSMVKSGTTYKIVTDHLGSVRMVINSTTGAIAQQIDYDEFGRVLSDTNPGFQPFGFAGGIYDPDTKLVRFGARDYDAETGRWTAKDPILFEGGDTNLYGYVLQDPINWIDPSGLAPNSRQVFDPGKGFDGGIPSGGMVGGGKSQTPVTQGAGRAPRTSTPNSIYEQLSNGGTSSGSRTFYDGNGRPFCRQDFKPGHGINGPHEHQFQFNNLGQPTSAETFNPVPPGYSTPIKGD